MKIQQAVRTLPFEHISEEVVSRKVFNQRFIRYIGIGSFIIIFSLFIGMLGYKYIVGVYGWDDAFYNASMILTGMGPVVDSKIELSTSAKIFSGLYAIYSGVAFLSAITIVFSPVLHRFLHILHADVKD